MGMFTKVSSDAMQTLQLDAGVLLSTFDPANPVEPASENIIATTTGGIQVTCTPAFSDFGEDVDNLINGAMEFQHLDTWDCTMAFTNIKFNAANTVWALGAAEKTSTAATTGQNPTRAYDKIVPRRDLKQTDFKDIWWVGDKVNGGAFAVKLINALSTGGLSIQSTKNGKGTYGMTLKGHVSIAAQDVMPMEFYDISPAESV